MRSYYHRIRFTEPELDLLIAALAVLIARTGNAQIRGEAGMLKYRLARTANRVRRQRSQPPRD